jgi:uncharacterized protein (UPF0333 family)
MDRVPRPAADDASRGQASVELVALLPVLALVAAIAWQFVLVAHTGWAVSKAARAAARADAVGDSASAAAHEALPERLRRTARITVAGDGAVRVVARIPRVAPAPSLGTLSASERFEGGG